ncbi:hypothetical protein P43SY_004454 [Pythium insidiosum]|uniref:t-SNARE coiled-coil homology domain-containing protein n=1 Tax=Pythium insidiosum TaxID=114742 RepID=A0AAD5LQU9_PYTIN|nr:hypothetical protein P43SY_004454 [Pythium insidiosum]
MSTNTAASGDPFYVFKDELETKVSAVQQQYARWKAAFEAKDGTTGKELPTLTTQITSAVSSAEKSLKFLEQTIVMVEANRSKFEHIDNELLAVSSDISSDAAKARVRKEEQKQLKPLVSSPPSNRHVDDNARFLSEETARQNQIMREQDTNLDGLHKSVTRLNEVAVTINHEVKSQNKMLDDLSDDVDTAQEQMNFVMDRMSKLLKTKDKCQLGLIIVLCLVLVVMVFLVIYT